MFSRFRRVHDRRISSDSGREESAETWRNLALMAGFGFLIAMHLYLLFYAIYLVGRAIVYCLNQLAQR